MAKDKKGKGSGTKDACYHKVKSRYSVWPSAYASGALVKCRKVGAANWGNSTKKEEFEGQVLENVGNEPKLKPGSGLGGGKTVYPKGQEPKPTGAKLPKIKKVTEGKHSKSETYVKGTAPVRATYGGKTESFPKETYNKKSKKVEVSEGDKYDNVGKQAARMSLLNNPGPRSTPEQTAEKKARLEKKRGMKLDDHPQYQKEGYGAPGHNPGSGEKSVARAKALMDKQGRKGAPGLDAMAAAKKEHEARRGVKKEEVDKRRAPAELVARLSAKREGHMAQDGPNKAAYDAKQRILKKTKEKMAEQMLSEKPYQITGPHSYTAGDGDPKDDVKIEKTPYNVGKPMKSKVRARNKVDKMNQEYGASVYRMKYVEGIEDSVQKMLDEAGKKCWKGYKKAGTQKLFGKTYNRCVKANEELSIDQQMKISRDYNRMSPEEKKAANKKAMGNVKKVAPKKDTRTDAQKMVDAAYGKRPTNPKGSLGT